MRIPIENSMAGVSSRYGVSGQIELYGVESAAKIRNVETYEISEYSGPIDEEFLTIAKSVE